MACGITAAAPPSYSPLKRGRRALAARYIGAAVQRREVKCGGDDLLPLFRGE
jgi:hypothetical protein